MSQWYIGNAPGSNLQPRVLDIRIQPIGLLVLGLTQFVFRRPL
jgi:hypothetical protein